MTRSKLATVFLACQAMVSCQKPPTTNPVSLTPSPASETTQPSDSAPADTPADTPVITKEIIQDATNTSTDSTTDGTSGISTDATGSSGSNSTTQDSSQATSLVFKGIVLDHAAADGYVNESEFLSPLTAILLDATRYVSAAYSQPLPSSGLICNQSLTYQTAIPLISDIPGTDGTYAICVKITTKTAQSLYAKSPIITRDTSPPVVTGITSSTEIADHYLTTTEATTGNLLGQLVASSYSAASYTSLISNINGVTCDAQQTYSRSTIPLASDAMTVRTTYGFCAKVSDVAGNTRFAKSAAFYRLGVRPPAIQNLAIVRSDSQLDLSWLSGGGTTSGITLIRLIGPSTADVATAQSWVPPHGTTFVQGNSVSIPGIGSPATVVYEGLNTTLTNSGLVNGVLFLYLAFAHDIDGQYSLINSASEAPRSPTVKMVGHGSVTDVKMDWADRTSLKGSKIYVGNYYGGAVIVDVSNPTTPVFRGKLALSGRTRYFTAYDNTYGYALNSSGLVVVNISDPDNLTQGNTIASGNCGTGLAYKGSYALVSCLSSGVQIYSLADPTLPVLVTTVTSTNNYAQDIVVSGNYAYVANGGSFYIIDITDPTLPITKGSFNDSGILGDAISIYTVNNKVYVLDDSNGYVYELNVSDVNSPTLANKWSIEYGYTGLCGTNTQLYAASGSMGLNMFDVYPNAIKLNSTVPSAVGSTRYIYDCVAMGDYAYTIEDKDIGIFHLESTTTTPAGYADIFGRTYDMAMNGSYIFAATFESGLSILDASNPLHPTVVSQTYVRNQNASRGVAVNAAGSTAFIADDSYGLKIYDTTNKLAPAQLSVLNLMTVAQKIRLTTNEQYALIATSNGLAIVDISNLTTPTLLTTALSGLAVFDLSLSGNTVYAGTSTGLSILDITTIGTPAVVGTWNAPTTTTGGGLTVSGTTAYLASGTWGVYIVDLSNPGAPVTMNSIPTSTVSNATHAFPFGNQLYVSGDANTVYSFNIAAPTANPLPQLTTFFSYGVPQRISFVVGNNAYVPSERAGFTIITLP